jgi:3,4-dihydroxy 2-butanone 4-phosphate synthase/GTP cyclohydrolase II
MSVSPTPQLIDDIRRGRMIVLADAEDRENEGDLLMAADFVTPEAINFMATHARGLICLTLTEERCRQLGLSLMVNDNRSPHGTAFTTSIEAAHGVTTGISAADRARTIHAATARHAKPEDIVQPGHVFPVMAQRGGVLVRAGHTEAGCDLAELAGLTPATVICEIMNPDGSMARMPELVEFAGKHGLSLGTIADLIHHRSENEKLVERVAERQITTAYGPFRLCVYRDKTVDEVHYALVRGVPAPDRPTLVRVHEPFVSLDLFDFDATRHAFSVQHAMRMIAHHNEGVLVLLRRDASADEIIERLEDSPLHRRSTRAWDPRLHGIGAQILRDLGVGKMRVLARPKRIPSMSGFGLEVVEYVSPDDAAAVKAI